MLSHHRDEILHTVSLPHYFDSAFDRRQVHRYLPAKLSREAFDDAVQGLIRDGRLVEKGGYLYGREIAAGDQRREWSRALFRRHRRHLAALGRFPWVRFIGLSGANAFESCRPQDDVDLFIVTARQRLWLAFATMIACNRVLGRRDLFCINYLVDEDHLALEHRSYYTAVQLLSMVPVVDRGAGAALLEANDWVRAYLPNAALAFEADPFYALDLAPRRRPAPSAGTRLAADLNRRIYRGYARRLQRKYADAFGTGIVVGEGVAKLHPVDYSGVYQQISGEGRADP